MDKSSEESLIKEIKTNPRDIMAHGNLGNVYVKQERYNEAIEAYQKVIEIDPEQIAEYNNLIDKYKRILQNKIKKKPLRFFRKLFSVFRK